MSSSESPILNEYGYGSKKCTTPGGAMGSPAHLLWSPVAASAPLVPPWYDRYLFEIRGEREAGGGGGGGGGVGPKNGKKKKTIRKVHQTKKKKN